MFKDTATLLIFTMIVLSLPHKELALFLRRCNKELELKPHLSVHDLEKLRPAVPLKNR